MICKHDQLYRINNEKSGGAGCPMCNAQRTKRVVMTSVNTAAKQITTVDPDWLCHLCGIQQPAWAGDCLTCETTPMMGDRE